MQSADFLSEQIAKKLKAAESLLAELDIDTFGQFYAVTNFASASVASLWMAVGHDEQSTAKAVLSVPAPSTEEMRELAVIARPYLARRNAKPDDVLLNQVCEVYHLLLELHLMTMNLRNMFKVDKPASTVPKKRKPAGRTPGKVKLSKAELECIRLHGEGVKPAEIDERMINRNAKRANGNQWDWQDAKRVVKAHNARVERSQKNHETIT